MKAYGYFAALLLCTCSIAQGGFVQIWSFQQLFDQADVVMICSIKEPTKRIGTKAKLPSSSLELDDVTTHFKKRAILKGSFEAQAWRFRHYWFTEDTKTLVSAPALKKFDAIDKAYLIFLKKTPSGDLVPVSGQTQPASSFIETEPDGVMLFEPLLAPEDKVEQDAAGQEPARREPKGK